MNLSEALKPELEKLVNESKIALGEVKKVAVSQAWKMLQLAIVEIIQKIEYNGKNIAGKDKKTIAMELLSQFYDSVFIIVDIPFIPAVIESIIHKYVKTFLMTLVGSTIDAMVITFKNIGVFDNNPKPVV